MNPAVIVGPPAVRYSDQHEKFTMFDIQVRQANLGNHWEATIEAGGKVFTARHADKHQAIHDVGRAAHEAANAGEIKVGVI